MSEDGYAKAVLVTTEWLAEHLGDEGLVVAEVDESPELYDEGHIPGAVKLHWRDDLQDPVERDVVDRETFEALLGSRGIGNDTAVILYGDKNNWFAAYAYWYLKLYGHEDVRILDGGRQKWIDEGRDLTADVPAPDAASYSASEQDASLRAYRNQVLDGLGDGGRALVDVRSPGEYAGDLIAPPGYEQEGAQRGGHIPTARVDSVGDRGRGRRHVQVRRRAARDLRRQGRDTPTRRSRRTAASASARRTRGSSSASSSATRTSATTTARGPSGATSSTCRSSAARSR